MEDGAFSCMVAVHCITVTLNTTYASLLWQCHRESHKLVDDFSVKAINLRIILTGKS